MRRRRRKATRRLLDPNTLLTSVIAITLTALLLVMAVGSSHNAESPADAAKDATSATSSPATTTSESTYDALILGANEITSNKSEAVGVGKFTLKGRTLTFTINTAGLNDGEITGVHIHDEAVKDSNGKTVRGAILYDLGTIAPATCKQDAGETVCTSSGSLTIDSAHKEKLNSGKLHINIHTKRLPSGEIRGNIVPTTSTASPS